MSKFFVSASAIAIVAMCAPIAPSAFVRDGDAGQLTEEKVGEVFAVQRPYSPYADRNFPTRPLFGDTHTSTPALRSMPEPSEPA